MNIDEQKMVDEVMDWFDWERVHKVMEFLDWKWGLAGEVPSIQELRSKAREHMYIVIDANKPQYMITSGGLKATAFRDEKSGKLTGVHLEFVLADWYAGEEK